MVDFARSRTVEIVEICDVDQLWDGEMEHFHAGGTTILLLKIAGEFHAYQGRCPHQGAALVEGELDRGLLTCAAHLWQFDATTGQGVNPESARLQRFPVHVVDGRVLVEVELGGVDGAPQPLCENQLGMERS